MGRKRWRRRLLIALAVLVVLVVAAGVPAGIFLTRDRPENFSGIVQEFKYGSAGTEAEQGFPYDLWVVLPKVFADLLPRGQGQGWERVGFMYDRSDEPKAHPRPMGTSFRDKPVGLIGLNCAACHIGTYRVTPSSPRELVLGMPATRFNIGAYIEFLRAVGRDKRFNADTLMPAIERRFHLSRFQRVFYRYVVIPRTKTALHKLDEDFSWMERWPPQGPGRVSTFTPWKIKFDYDLHAANAVGTVDYPSIWDQAIRKHLHLHWDGNNGSLLERNISAALAVGATPDSIDIGVLKRLDKWLLYKQPPRFPRARIDEALAARGRTLYDASCAACHAVGGSRLGQVTPLSQIGTDPARERSFGTRIAKRMDEIGKGKPWAFSHFRHTDGYANAPLDGIWLRAPYLHNGSVPTLRALLFPELRPKVFYSGYDVYDWRDVGFVAEGPAARREGSKFDTRLRGNHNTGHLYGTGLPKAARLAILEYLKTL